MTYLARSTADLRIFRKLYLWNKEASLSLNQAAGHLGHMRYGMPAYHAQINVAMKGSLSPVPPDLVIFSGGFFGGYLPPEGSDQKYWDTIEAFSSVTLARDKVLALTAQHTPLRAGDNVPLSLSYSVGDYIRRW